MRTALNAHEFPRAEQLHLSCGFRSLDSAYKKGEKDVGELGIGYLGSEDQYPDTAAVLHPISAMEAVIHTFFQERYRAAFNPSALIELRRHQCQWQKCGTKDTAKQ